MSFAVPPLSPVSIEIADSTDCFPVARAFCIGRNYAEHSIEMGGNPDREEPFFFMKPATAIIPGGGTLPYPSATSELHHEVELVVALHKGGRDIKVADASSHIFGYAAGLDMTRRDLQAAAKKAGRPWDMAKGFDASGPVGVLVPAAASSHVTYAAIELTINGETRQKGNVNQMIWKTDEAIAYLSGLVELMAGDIIFTGTPAGVGPVERGDTLHATIAGLPDMTCRVS
ncbi:MAG: fumarylacetoacetate hydrolase family protein [Alphaproteobacteria bacterium]|jgi:fumarylpyruvate hydrolase|nr:fumarylacetoacetate hydrolase family protein [Rhodospirillaceae bacterium]MBT6202578.1 fumarylacetoacetate hydrolase family protein [Rhodospirillaceae bacterium]MBT6510596.1 fumarylacetoacetate hydrolase family protein [Rhodospirillaceae bacterium]MDG2479901.1 fumarylacetoacetate hydrolase family protein [Alphaproteobacteria bacterium]